MLSPIKSWNMFIMKRQFPEMLEQAREMVASPEPFKGFVINNSKWYDKMMKEFEIEKDRMNSYKDNWAMLQESTIVNKSNEAMSQDATGQPFKLIVNSQVHEKIGKNLFKRIKYQYLRSMLVARGIALGDLFIKCDVGRTYGIRKLGSIEQIRLLPEFTMYRNSDFSGNFPVPWQAFTQRSKPGNFEVNAGFDGFHLDNPIHFSLGEVIHGRYDYLRQINPKYGKSAYDSARVQYSMVMMMLKDLAVARRQSTFNRLVHMIDSKASLDVDKYRQEVEATEPTAFQEHVIQGGEIRGLDQKNSMVANIDDVKLQIDLLKLALYPIEYFGYIGSSSVTGEQIKMMEVRLKRAISFIHAFEEYEIIRPLLDREFLLHGYQNVDYEIEFPPISFEDENKTAKREISKVQARTKSIKEAMRTMENWSDEKITEVMKELEEEWMLFETLREKYQPGPENLDKGGKGVTKENSEEQDIHDTEGTGDDE